MIGDTTLSNNQTYKIIQYRRYSEVFFSYERVDHDSLIVYKYSPSYQTGALGNEAPIFLLPISSSARTIQAGSWTLQCYWDGVESFLGWEQPVWRCSKRRLSSYFSQAYKLVSQLGVVYLFEDAESYFLFDHLIYFWSNNIERGIPVGIESAAELPAEPDIMVYPNPARKSDLIHIAFGNDLQPNDAVVYDILGRQIATHLVAASQEVLTLKMPETAIAGTYFVSVRSRLGVSTQYFVFWN